LDHAGIDYSERKAIPIEINPSAEMFLEVTLPDTVLKNTSKRATLQTEYSNIGRT